MLDRFAAGLALAVLAAALRPWWSVRSRSARWEDGHESNIVFTTYGRMVWQVSTRWTVAVLLAVAVAMVWMAFLLWRRRIPFLARVLALGVVVIAIGLTIAGWRDIEHWPPPNAVARAEIRIDPIDAHRDVERALLDDWAERDHLRRIHTSGLTADVAGGMWVGLVAMSLTAGALFASMLVRPRRTAGPAGPPAPASDD